MSASPALSALRRATVADHAALEHEAEIESLEAEIKKARSELKKLQAELERITH
jgi:multidrug resistance efflux pump